MKTMVEAWEELALAVADLRLAVRTALRGAFPWLLLSQKKQRGPEDQALPGGQEEVTEGRT